MSHTPDGQIGAKVGAPPLYSDLVVPVGLTFADLHEAAKYVWDFGLDEPASEGDPTNDYELVAKIYECLKAAAARNEGIETKTAEASDELRDLPDLDDMLRVGMPLSDALAFWNEMMSSADRSVSVWWQRLKVWRQASQLLQNALE